MIIVQNRKKDIELPGTKNFGISDLERFSGVKAHTLRIWELRYNVPAPQRTNSNFRYYSLEEVIKISKLALLNRNGYKISNLITYSSQKLEERLKGLTDVETLQQAAVINLIDYMYSMNAEGFEEVINKNFSLYGIHVSINGIIYPFLKITDLMWQGRRLTEEHLVVTILRKKMLYAIENLPKNGAFKKTVILFLADTKQLDLGLLYTYYYLKCSGIQIFYLGNDVSAENVKAISERFNPDHLFTYCPASNCGWFAKFLAEIEETRYSSRFIFTTQPDNANFCFSTTGLQPTHFEDALEMMS